MLPSYTSWLELDDIDVPSWSRRPQLWRAAIDIARAAPPVTAGGFVHHDYQPFNLLWSPDGRLCGVVDWVWASQGPPDDDVAHCRLNLCLLYSAERAEQFRQRYERAAGRAMDTWWAVASLVDYLGGWTAEGLQEQAGRRLRVDAAGIDARVEELLAMTLRAAG